MPQNPRIIRSITEFRKHYADLQAGDLVLGLLPLKSGEEVKLIEILDRGVGVFPAALAQLLSRSKAAQAEVLGKFMVPGTCVVYSSADLAARLSSPALQGQVVCKADKAHLGLGVSLWPTLETLVSLAGVQTLPDPLVLQPFVAGAQDIRAVVVGDYAEAYERVNPHSFRKNLFQGGSSRPAMLEPEHLEFCRQAMARGKFPYALLDLLLSPGGEIFLSEINVKGGLKGSRLGQAGFRERVKRLEEEFAQSWVGSSKIPV
jgi:glutathione synthase/RimK-type ligase-like ATP-grasp enzyme